MLEIILIILLLAIMEISFSFDNAIVNAKVLADMPEKWRKRFLTWGMLIAVVGMRLIFPIAIVAATTGLGLITVADMAINAPGEYSEHLIASHIKIAAFGGMFLMMVFLSFLMDKDKDCHWLKAERHFVGLVGAFCACAWIVSLMVYLLPYAHRVEFLISGWLGIILYWLMDKLKGTPVKTASSGLGAFLYLEVLDMSFSLDGVIGAFALSNNLFVIMVGLGIGAYFVRSMTIGLVKKRTLKNYIYLEHGAHYGIGALAICMLVGTIYPVPELITGLVGVGFIGLSLMSSVKHNRRIAA